METALTGLLTQGGITVAMAGALLWYFQTTQKAAQKREENLVMRLEKLEDAWRSTMMDLLIRTEKALMETADALKALRGRREGDKPLELP